jgi:predicted O-methyltransferase YrrM
MSFRSIRPTAALLDYVQSVSLREPEVLQRLREETMRQAYGGMQIDAEQGQFMALLARLIGAKSCLEIGTFTGYSALWVALALPPGGRLIACDVDARMPAIGQRYWQAAGVADKIEFRLGPALGTLDALLAAGEAGDFDFAFIDADKENYDAYYERVLPLLRPGGLVLIDNVLWGGSVAEDKTRDRTTTALRALNRKIHDDARVDPCLLVMGDGLTIARKR